MLLACIDIGTLTCRLLIAEVNAAELKIAGSDRRILRLGEGVDQHKRLSQPAMDRVVATLKEWKDKTAAYPLQAIAVVATSAVRESENRQAFLTRIHDETGWQVELLTGEEEARRTLLGLRFGLPSSVTDFLGVDIGGGSTECILVREGLPPEVMSLEMGVVRLLERVIRHDPPTVQDIQEAETVIDKELAKVSAGFGPLRGLPLVGTAGTVTTLAAMAQGLPRYESARVHNFQLTLAVIERLEQELFTRTAPQRLTMPGLEPGREQVIVAGTLILRRLMTFFGFDTCLVSDFGLREGVLVDLANKQMM